MVELVIFLLGSFFLLRFFYELIKTLQRVFLGTPVTLERYGPMGTWAVVTGSTDGIGKAVALELASRGFNIALIARNIDKLKDTAKECQQKGNASARGNIDTRVIVFDFCEDTSI